MGVNKVVFGEVSIMDISDSTVTPETLAEGVVAYNAAGERVVGTMKTNTDPLAGKTIVLIGDSLMTGEGWTGGWGNLIKEKHPDANIVNLAVGGARFCNANDGAGNAWIVDQGVRMTAEGIDADIILVGTGGNDFFTNCPLGAVDYSTIDGNTWDTTASAFDSFMCGFRMHDYNRQVIYISGIIYKSMDLVGQKNLYDTLKAISGKWGIPVADLTCEGSINYMTDEYSVYYTSDGVHLNEAGYRLTYPVIENAINKVVCLY